MAEVRITESCPLCGSDLTLHTDASQPEVGGWCCWDGDEVACDDCGAKGAMSADGGEAWVGGMTCAHGEADDESCEECDDG
jgi:hypothetical protein